MTPPDPGTDKWNQRYREQPFRVEPPCEIISQLRHMLPEQRGAALDLASGLGGNALFLAEQGFTVSAWDISKVAMGMLQDHCKRNDLAVNCAVRDLTQQPPEPNSFDLIVVSFFLSRDLAPHICRALRKGGVLFYQTHTLERINPGGPSNTDYLLRPNELLQLFSDLRILHYREEGSIGNTRLGVRNSAWLVANKV